MNLILGAGLSGLSASYHLGHADCVLLEEKTRPFGHITSHQQSGFTWDEGPHVSFTKSEYVRNLFAAAVDQQFEEHEVLVSNYYKGLWIDHPAQSHLYQVPQPLREECLNSFLQSRQKTARPPANYAEWLDVAFGPVFARTFPTVYTEKYWTIHPEKLSTDWVGSRVFKPSVEDVQQGARERLPEKTHYITQIRYPTKGGYQSYAQPLALEANIHFNKKITEIDLATRSVKCADGSVYGYTRLISTIPLPIFIRACRQSTPAMKEAAKALLCSELLLVNTAVHHPTKRKEHWIYVYDSDFLSTRINCTEKLSPHNAPAGMSGVQVEVYASRLNPFQETFPAISARVRTELATMGLIEPSEIDEKASHFRFTPYANVIFTLETKDLLETIWQGLLPWGLRREADDTHPLTDWNSITPDQCGSLAFSGRFGQWKYFWTDDCVLRGRHLAAAVNKPLTRLCTNAGYTDYL